MYKEIHPYFYDTFSAMNDVHGNVRKSETDYYKPAKPIVLKIEEIKQIISNEEESFVRLKVNDDYQNDIIIPKEEGEEIKKLLLRNSSDELAKEVERLTASIRDMYTLLRARLK